MSKLIVEVCAVDEVFPHPNADRLEICRIKGWEVISLKGQFKQGDRCVYIPYDVVLPPELANGPDDDPVGRLDVVKYCAPLPKHYTGKRMPGSRVRAARLRGHKSFGIIMQINPELGDDPQWEVGDDVAEHFGIEKWEPPEKCEDGDAAKSNSRFHTYTDIDKYANYPNCIENGTEVVFSEKIHGMNCRLGYVIAPNEEGDASWTLMAGSHGVRRKEFTKKGKRSQFWDAFTDKIKKLLEMIASDDFEWHVPKLSILIFGELYGVGIQDMAYGLHGKEFRVFDIAINEEYLDFDVRHSLLERFDIPIAPILYRGPFSPETLENYTIGPTILCAPEKAGKFKGREGVVCTPVKEHFSSILGGRCIVKSVSVDYLSRRSATDNR